MKVGYKEESELDIKGDVDVLKIGDSDLSEEFKDRKLRQSLKLRLKIKVKEESQRLQGEYETKLVKDTQTHKVELVEKVDSYLNYVVKWMIKKTRSLLREVSKAKLFEDFIGGLKKLFEDHYIDVAPDEKYNVD